LSRASGADAEDGRGCNVARGIVRMVNESAQCVRDPYGQRTEVDGVGIIGLLVTIILIIILLRLL
jgi:hypothetical protein